jgi:hypothetical protein
MYLVAFSSNASFRNNHFFLILREICEESFGLFFLVDFDLIQESTAWNSDKGFSSLFALHSSRAAILPVDSIDSFESQMREIVH